MRARYHRSMICEPTACIRFYGHATAQIELGGAAVLTDPVLRGRVAHLRRRRPHHHPERTTDTVIISHIHQDHLDRPSLERLGRDTRLIVPLGAGRLVRRWGFHRVDEAAPGDLLTVAEGVSVRATHAEHSGFRPPLGPRALCLGYVVTGGGHRVYFAGDTDLFPEMAALGPVDVALLPVWGWGPNLGPGHLDPLEAARALTLIRPAVAVPIHWGSLYPLGLHGRMHHHLIHPPHTFARHARELAPAVDIRVVPVGGALCHDGERWG